MNRLSFNQWKIILGIFLLIASSAMFFVHYLIFEDLHHIFIFLVHDIAFIPIEVLLVTMVIHKLLEERQKKQTLQKVNILIGIFFQEAGRELLISFAKFDNSLERKKKILDVKNWSEVNFRNVQKQLRNLNYSIDVTAIEFEKLTQLLSEKRKLSSKLLANPILLQNTSFTELLQILIHLDEEFRMVLDINKLSVNDKVHVADDLKQAYRLLIKEWLEYMHHLKEVYPNFYTFAVKINPFNKEDAESFLNKIRENKK